MKLFDDQYIYRGKRMVNWCPASLTALSDEEVIMKPVQSVMYRVRYELDGAARQLYRGEDDASGNNSRGRGHRGAS